MKPSKNQLDAMRTIKSFYSRLTKQEFNTLKGQVKSGNEENAIKGLKSILRAKKTKGI